MKKIFAVVLCFCFFSLFCSCSNFNDLTVISIFSDEDCEHFENIEGIDNKKTAYEFDFNSYSYAGISFKYSNAKPDTLYEISAYIFSDNIICQNKNTKAIYLQNQSKDDINYNTVFSNNINSETIYNDDYSWIEISHIIYNLDEETLYFDLILGDENNKIVGDVFIDKISITPITYSKDYIEVSSADASTILLFPRIDNIENDLAVLENYCNILSECRKSLCNFVNDDYTNGKTYYIVTQSVDHFAVSGCPIYVDNTQIDNIINSAKEIKNDYCDQTFFAMVHEMSHTFDRICGTKTDKLWQFDSEFWASIKAIYSIENSGYSLSEEINDLFDTSSTENNGLYSDEFLTKRFIEITNKYGWNSIIKAIDGFTNTAYSTIETTYDKFLLFKQLYNKNSEVELECEFSNSEWEMIIDYMRNN